jgi:hypothetical protein
VQAAARGLASKAVVSAQAALVPGETLAAAAGAVAAASG